ncbi:MULTISPECIES: cysteine hydrolase family protein [Sporosarcina]|uniref:hypothetical protein n=1 Tax=Sporosarcina TaxID=1569 RepID=UPI001E44648E|nr:MULTISPECIES: hypothetical protein [Sporosarcina]GKV66507.1 hypothetical protein NCCP2331_26600 [Sporosarcina sp. NCCP-2331]GLB56784.1 hypothetical protein NCCP2378_25710 [Sporosarcina sp. NCCP-2378]
MMKTKFEEIVDVSKIGTVSAKRINELAELAAAEKLAPFNEDVEKVLFIGIDFQNDFMENGELGVPNSHQDIERVTKFLYQNLDKITTIALSLDTHGLQQIFHTSWWSDAEGNHPIPFTVITREDVESGRWKALEKQKESLDYIIHLEHRGKKQLLIWPYHCIEGTYGAALEGQFSNIVHFHSMTRKSVIQKIVKGQDPLSEMYGIIKPEYAGEEQTNYAFLDSLHAYDKIIIAGEAKSHCVLESVLQIVEYNERRPELLSKIYLLEDCMSSIPGFEESTERACKELQKNYGIHLVKSTEIML